MNGFFVMCFALVFVFALTVNAAFMKVDTKSKTYVDSANRVRLFHGTNVVYKLAPYYPLLDRNDPRLSLTDDDMRNMTKWGFNVVRLGVMWEAVEAVRGEYNTTYLAIVRRLVDKLGSYGIYTIVDAHQDVMNRRFCGEDIPDWAIQPSAATSGPLLDFPSPMPFDLHKDKDGIPETAACMSHNFFLYSTTFAVNSAWGALYDPRTHLTEAFAGFWGAVATAFADSPYVLGYELLNEPWGGNAWLHLVESIFGTKADTLLLAPLYQAAHKAIRAVDDHHIIMFEPCVSEGYVYAPNGFGTQHSPGGPAYDDRQALAYHLYCQVNASGEVPPGTPLASCESMLLKGMETTLSALLPPGGDPGYGAFLTEFGAVGNTPSSLQAMKTLTKAADERLQSWAYWTFKSYHDITTINQKTESLFLNDGTVQQDKLTVLSRTYAQAIAGDPLSIHMSFDPETSDFSLSYTPHATTVGSATEVFLNERLHYPCGADVALVTSGGSGAGAQWSRVDDSHIHVTHPTAEAGSTVTLTITRTPCKTE